MSRGRFVAFLLILALALGLLVFLGKRPGSPSPSPSAVVNSSDADEVVEARKSKAAVGVDNGHEMRQVLASENDVPIVFYGRLEDQFGNPVVGAEVTGNIIVDNGTTAGVDRCFAKSDSSGLFKLEAGKGESLGVIPRKQGYALATRQTEFKYSRLYPGFHLPDPANPSVIQMWKLQGSEPLVPISCRFRFPCTNVPTRFDLLTGKVVPEGGDIKMVLNRPEGVISSNNHLDWSVEIEAVSGGIQDSGGTEGVTYEAPEGGYEPTRIIHSSDKLPEGGLGGFRTGFYLKSRNGQVYSKVSLSFGINRKPEDPIRVEFDGVANTNSSRNFEGDPNTYKP